jgi:hypothetical protein
MLESILIALSMVAQTAVAQDIQASFHRKSFKRLGLFGVWASGDRCLDAHFERSVFR